MKALSSESSFDSTTNRCRVSGESPMEEIANAITHGLGLVLSILALFTLVTLSITHSTPIMVAGCTVFGISLVLLYGASTLYHCCSSLRLKHVFKIVDHACIFLLIAGSYTPLTLGPIQGSLGWGLLSTVWLITVIGIPLKAKYVHVKGFKPIIPYLFMGWLSVIALGPLWEGLGVEGFIWMMAGGAFYSLGALVYLMESIPFNHSIWHLFVLGGSACHYITVVYYVIPYF